MQDEVSLGTFNEATLRLVNRSWGNYLQQFLAHLKKQGRARASDGTEALIKLYKRLRPTTYYHSVRVSKITHGLGRAFNLEAPRMKQLCATAMMHDIGKILVPESILNRPRKPTRTERFILKMHPNFGALLASYFNLAPELRVRTQHHHECWDGRGYPHRLGGTDIPFMARVVQVADSYDAMVATDRCYRRPLTHQEALKELRRCAGKQFDPSVVTAFADTFPESPLF